MIRFADCELNLDRIVLRRGGEEIRVEPQVFDVLAYLVKHRGAVVRKEELLDAIWGDRFVSESALTTRIKAVRQAVGDDGSQQLIIRTVHGKGYEFVAEVEEVEEVEERRTVTASPRHAPCLEDPRLHFLPNFALRLLVSRSFVCRCLYCSSDLACGRSSDFNGNSGSSPR